MANLLKPDRDLVRGRDAESRLAELEAQLKQARLSASSYAAFRLGYQASQARGKVSALKRRIKALRPHVQATYAWEAVREHGNDYY